MSTYPEWPGKLSREQAIKLIERSTDKSDPYWSNLVEDLYDEKTDTLPTIYHVLDALGVTQEEYTAATGDEAENWPKPNYKIDGVDLAPGPSWSAVTFTEGRDRPEDDGL